MRFNKQKILTALFLVALISAPWTLPENMPREVKNSFTTALTAAVRSINPINEQDVLVVQVIDGDTIEIEGGEHVRYVGIDTPETVHPEKPVECFGVEAKEKNRMLVEGKRVRLEKDVTDRDKYNRLLRYVYVGDTFVNRELVRTGYARIYTFPPNVKYHSQFLLDAREARLAQAGLWSSCNK